MNEQYKSTIDGDRAPVIEPGHTFGTVTEKISAIVLTRPASNGWFLGFGIAFMLTMMMLYAIGYLVLKGTGIWGVTIPIGWGFAIVNFVWWIGIGHAGTLISAILLLLRQSWRNSINRFAEAMTLFAVACAGIFPAIHVGRPWLAYWLFPYPNTMSVWPQFRSPLMWDVFAVSTYATISALFWFIGLIPDLATLRDRTENPALRIIYGMLSFGWRGSARHWHRYETAYLLLAGLATPLVVSVHTVVSFDFAVGIVPGWHTTIFPPYFVAGAIYSGFAMVLMLAIPIRKIYGLEDFITERHLQNSAKVMLATGLIVGYGYMIEGFMGWYGGNRYDAFTLWNRLHGPLCRSVLDAAHLQHLHPASSVDSQTAHQSRRVVFCLRRDSGWHVAGALRHRRHEPASRLPDFFLGHVLPHPLGLDDLHRHHRHVPHAHVPVPARAARDLDF